MLPLTQPNGIKISFILLAVPVVSLARHVKKAHTQSQDVPLINSSGDKSTGRTNMTCNHASNEN